MRSYRKTIQSPAVKRFAVDYARHNNATKAARDNFPTLNSDQVAANKGRRLLSKREVVADITAQRKKIENHADKAIDQLAELSQSARSEMVRYSASGYMVDQAHGKATQRIEQQSRSVTINIDITGGKYGKPTKAVLDELKKS